MFLPNMISYPAKYWSKYIEFMYSFNFEAVNLPYLTWCTVLVHNDGPKRTDTSTWQSPIDHHSIYWLYFLLLADTLDVDRSLGWVEFEGLRSCQMWVFNKFDWIFHKFTENGEFYIVWFLALTGMIETPAFWGDFGNILAVLKWFGHVKLFCV